MSHVSKKHYQSFKDEVEAHIKTKEISLQRMRQITFIMGENIQLHKELEKERELNAELMHRHVLD